jgi:hypothetical protein
VSTHIEWLTAADISVRGFAAGADAGPILRAGAGEAVLTLAGDDVVVIQGTPTELRALAARIAAEVKDL